MDDLLEEAQHFRLEGSKLKACLKDNDGGWRNAELDLDRYIGNTDGKAPATQIHTHTPHTHTHQRPL